MASNTPDYEKLGTFYLGTVCAAANADDAGAAADADNTTADASGEGAGPLLYDAKDLTTHALCVGMTGSGKTGLCLGLLEEAAIDGVPAIAIDPKGDLGNLLLAFPGLSAGEFEPWIDPAEATRAGRSVSEHAAAVASQWRQGLAASGQPPERVKRYRDAVDMCIYTPGSSAGMPISVLSSLRPPDPSLDSDAVRQRVTVTVSGLLSLLGIDADPLRSREHILLSTLVEQAWRQGTTVDVSQLIGLIINPPIERVGVLDVDTFFPAKDRRALAMALNNLLASPAFAAWLEGEPLDIQRLLWTDSGKPRLSILSIAHLSEQERMFFVTLLLGELIAWMRAQSGTSSLRALLYMDEVFGFFPPVNNPPSKGPMLTLLKQARAFGLGVVLATQNPVDVDYKGLSNCGTWFLGRLQTERDQQRVLDGLEGASSAGGAPFDRRRTEALLAGLPGRTFLMNNVHDDGPVLFRTRWVMSYLRGPLTRAQIKILCAERKAAAAVAVGAAGGAAPATAAAQQPAAAATTRVATAAATAAARVDVVATSAAARVKQQPLVTVDIPQLFMACAPTAAKVTYRPGLLATVTLHYVHRYSDIDQWLEPSLIVAWPARGKLSWKSAAWQHFDASLFGEVPVAGARFTKLPKDVTKKGIKALQSALKKHLLRSEALPVYYCRALKMWSRYGEGEAQLAARAQLSVREQRDMAVEKLRAKFAPKLARLAERVRKAEQRVGREQAQATQAGFSTALSVGATVLGAVFGRRVMGRAATSARGVGRTAQQRGDVVRAQQDVVVLKQQLLDMEAQFQDKVADLEQSPGAIHIDKKLIKPRKTDLAIERFALVWLPHVPADGALVPAWPHAG